MANIPKASATSVNEIPTTVIQELAGVTEDEKIIEIDKILTAWNPLGAAALNDLNNYQTEAIDIMSAMELFGYSPKKAVSEVLQEAFLIDLDKKELEHYSNRVKDILAR